jgi:hypothetical protein
VPNGAPATDELLGPGLAQGTRESPRQDDTELILTLARTACTNSTAVSPGEMSYEAEA